MTLNANVLYIDLRQFERKSPFEAPVLQDGTVLWLPGNGSLGIDTDRVVIGALDYGAQHLRNARDVNVFRFPSGEPIFYTWEPALSSIGAMAADDAIAVTVITNSHGAATKHFFLKDGKVEKRSAGQIYEGESHVKNIENLEALVALINELTPSKALTYGVPRKAFAQLTTQKNSGNGAIARDRKHFSYRVKEPGVLMLDHDPRPGGEPKSRKDIDRIIGEVLPEWRNVKRVWRASATSYITGPDGTEYVKQGGWRCYALVDDASMIPQIGAALYQALWAAGYGYIFVSKSGAQLDRSIVDASVWQPERLDFAAAPVMNDGLVRNPPPDLWFSGEEMLAAAPIAARAKDMKEWRANSEELKDARGDTRGEAKKVEKKFIKERTAELEKSGHKIDKATLEAAVQHSDLYDDFVLHGQSATVTVKDLLADPERYDGTRYADPLEPAYGHDSRIAVAYLCGEDQKKPLFSRGALGGVFFF
jgi:hypothetical protein